MMALKVSLVLVMAIALLQRGEAKNVTGKPISFNLLGIPVMLYCTPDGNMGGSDPATPPLKGANVELRCGKGDIIANVTTNSLGIGYLITKMQPVLHYSPVQDNCKLVVGTVQSSCNTTSAAGLLVSGLKFIGTLIFGHMKIANFGPTGFHINQVSSSDAEARFVH